MELFPDGSHVRLRTSNGGRYLHAKKDGLGTGLRSRRASLLAAWAVQHVVREGTVYLLLRSAAYGRYLGLRTVNAAPATQRICKAVLQLYDHRERRDIHWKVVMVQAATRRVRLQHRLHGTWYSPGGGASRNWVVEIIPPRLFAPELPEIVEPPLLQRVGHRTYAPPVEWTRRIRYVRADADGNIVQRLWRKFWFEGKSVSLLRNTLAARVGEADPQNITLCVRAGRFGRRTPLVIDLPENDREMDIIVLATGSEGADELRYPNVDAH